MAKLVAAYGSSHSVMLTAAEEDWRNGFKTADKTNPWLFDKEGNKTNYEGLLAKASKDNRQDVSPEAMSARWREAQAAMDHMRDLITDAPIDVLIICGDDQHELFKMTNMPAIAIYYGDTILNAKRKITPDMGWYKFAQAQRQEAEADVNWPVDSKLATWLIRKLSDRDFDIAALNGIEPGKCEGHAISFIHHRYMTKRKIPVVPILLNTFDPPNQPTPARCIKLGAALRQLIEEYPEDIRVGILASGGLSHFVVDEQLDNAVIDGIRRHDYSFLASIEPKLLQAGSSEIRNWILVAEAARDFDLDWVKYVPGYRTEAETGTGLCFAQWKRRA